MNIDLYLKVFTIHTLYAALLMVLLILKQEII
jgi:hypothetical protein